MTRSQRVLVPLPAFPLVHDVRTFPLDERHRPYAELLRGVAPNDHPDALTYPVTKLGGVLRRLESDLDLHERRLKGHLHHASKRAPWRAVAHSQSRSSGSSGISSNRSLRSFSLFSLNTRITSSWVTGGAPATPTS